MIRPELVPPARPTSAQPARAMLTAPAKKERTPAQIAAQQRAMAIMRQRNAERTSGKAAEQPTPQHPSLAVKLAEKQPKQVKGAAESPAPAYDLPGVSKGKVTGKGGKQVQAGMRPTPPPQNCTVCGYPRQFIGYQTKKGKDGRIAKWPGYEVCPHLNDPALHPHKAPAAEVRILQDYAHMTGNATASMFEFVGSASASKKSSGTLRAYPAHPAAPPAMLFYLEDSNIADAWGDAETGILGACILRLGAAPKYLYVHPEELAVRVAEKGLPKGVEVLARRNVMHQHVLASVKPQNDLPALQAK